MINPKLTELADNLPEGAEKLINASVKHAQQVAIATIMEWEHSNIDTPTAMVAMSMIVAHYLVMCDSEITEFEAQGHGLVTEEERLEIHMGGVKEWAGQLRAMNKARGKPSGH